MGNRFEDNVTPLNAATLNQFEEDLKQTASIPVYHALYEANDTGLNYKAYRISAVNWDDIPVGALFSVIFDQSTQGSTNEVIGLRFGTRGASTNYIFYSMPDYALTFESTQYVRVNNRKYLLANRPYIMKKLAASGASTPLIAVMDHFDTSKFGATLTVNEGKIVLKNLDGNAIGEAEMPTASETAFGAAKIWLSGTTLNIKTN